MKAEALTHVLAALRKVLKGELYVSPEFSERLIFQAVQSVEGGMGSPVDKLSDRELEVLERSDAAWERRALPLNSISA